MSAKSPWNTHTVLGIFHPRPVFAAEMTIVSPLPPSYNVESIAEASSYMKDTISPSSAIPITVKQHCCTEEGLLYFVYSINQRKCSKTFVDIVDISSSRLQISITSKELPQEKIMLSSVKLLISDCSIMYMKSLIKILKNNGPSTDL